MDAEQARELLERELPTVERLVAAVCRRHGLEGDDADTFASWLRFRLIDNDYAILRKFEGRSSLRTYLTAVVANLHRDHRIQRWGKWRPCAVARRMGGVAVLLDTYLNRDGHPLDEAIERILLRPGVEEDARDLRAMASRLPRRARRRFVDVESGDVTELILT